MVRPSVTVKVGEAAEAPLTVSDPVLARAGTEVRIVVVEMNAQEARVPLNFTDIEVHFVPDPVNPLPVTVTEVPTGPDVGVKLDTVAEACAAGTTTVNRASTGTRTRPS
jgi:hypothetical protein